MSRIAVFASGRGTNCENILLHFKENKSVCVSLIVSNNPKSPVFQLAEKHRVPAVLLTADDFCNEVRILSLLEEYQIDYIILAGFLLLIPPYLLQKYPRKIINIHPSLLPKYGGKGMYGHHVFEAVCQAGESETGITIHYLSEKYDEGEIIAQFKTSLLPTDTAEEIARKVHELEYHHYPSVIQAVVTNALPAFPEQDRADALLPIDIITMGCSKNLVDSQKLQQLFAESGFETYLNPDELHEGIAVVNTCGFIEAAKEESINMILELCGKKADGVLQKVFVMGCLSERYLQELQAEIPEVDKFYGKFDWKQLAEDLRTAYASVLPEQKRVDVSGKSARNHYAYVKIAEGCNRHCAFCAIPLITGKHKSRPMEEILQEMRELVAAGVKEFQIIEQELTYYGVDLYKQQMISQLVEQMAQIEGVEWIRLHYAYPNQFPEDLLRVIRAHQNVCSYLDIALQHISDNVLSRMHRHVTKSETFQLIEKIRSEVPGICLRTTLMVGFPGETEEDFAQLLDFVKTVRFDRMGAFMYSEEEGTFAAENYTDDVPTKTKQARLDRLMRVQERISAEINAQKVGQTLRTIIDRTEGDYYVGRTEFDSPEVDGEVLISKRENLRIGEFYNVFITSAEEFDLYGTTQHEKI